MQPPVQAGLPTPQPPQGDMPPMGTSPATGPTPNAGAEAQGMQHASLLLDAASELLPQVGAGTDVGRVLLKFITDLSKIVQPGAVSPAGKQNQLDRMQRNNAQNGQQMAMIRQGEQKPAPQQQPQAA